MSWLFLHGFAGGPASWTEVLADLRATPRLVPWLPGHGPAGAAPAIGFSDGASAPGATSFAAAVDRLAALVRESGHLPVHLVGYSLGARLGLGLLARHRGLCRRATLIGAHPGLADDGERAERRRHDATWAALLRSRGVAAFADDWEDQPLFASQRHAPAAARAAQRAVRLGHDAAGLARALDELGLAEMSDYRTELAAAAAALPIALVVGADDPRFAAIADGLAAAIPALAVERIAGAGHNPLLEAPSALAARLGRLDGSRSAAAGAQA